MTRALHAALAILMAAAAAAGAQNGSRRPACLPDNEGIRLPAGFCLSLFADSVPNARHMAIAANGDMYVASNGRGVFALRDADGDGRAETRINFGTNFRSSEVRLFDGHLYAENTSAIFRFPLRAGQLEPAGPADTIVSGMPNRGGHANKTFAIGRDGAMYVNFGSSGNVCPGTPAGGRGADPCPELNERAGIWRFDARKSGQTPATGEHFARGVRNAVGITIHPTTGQLWVAQHGRDNLKSYGGYWTDSVSAELPSEELFQINRGDDYGWPYCYYDHLQGKKMLAPEYGGDGREQGRCATAKAPVAGFPGHWAPNAVMFYTGAQFPARYRDGVFIAFHGSWNRAPLPQAGFNVVFQPLRDGRASGAYEVFANGWASNLAGQRPQGNRRPTGLVQGNDGSLFVADDAMGRIYRIVYTGTR